MSANTNDQKSQLQLSDVKVDNENTALNVMVAMLNMAQRRGAFTMEESSKCWECIKMFMKQNPEGADAQGDAAASPADASSGENMVM